MCQVIFKAQYITDITHSHDSHKKEALLGNTFMDEETEEQRG